LRNFVAIEGNIGAGKTTLAQMLAKHWNGKLLLEEFDDNPFLPQFYEQPDRFAFPVELFFLADRYHQLRNELSSPSLFHNLTVSDYFIGKSLIFSGANLKDDEYDLFTRLFNIMFDTLPKPDLLVYLYLDTPRLLKNIAMRGRSYEQQIAAEYLENVQQRYFQFLRQQQELTTLIVDTNSIDFVSNKSHFNSLVELISRDYPKGMHTVAVHP
jgi:deoxyadenosine/deoxycytidine kinase